MTKNDPQHRRRGAAQVFAPLAVALCALALSACTASPEQQPAETKRNTNTATPATPAPTNTPVAPTATADPTQVSHTIVCPSDGPPLTEFTGPAVTEFGAPAVMDAYCETAAFFAQRSITSLTDPDTSSAAVADLRFITDRLTVTAAQMWQQTLDTASSPAATDKAIQALTYYRLPAPAGYRYPAGGPLSVDATISPASADVARLTDGRPALSMWFTVTNTLPLAIRADGTPTYARTLTRDVAVYLVPNPDEAAPQDESWLIESWNTSWKASKPKPWASGR